MVTTEENLGRFPELGQSDEIDLTPRDSNILHAIQDEGLTVFAFDGLKRLLGVHQEMLSRVLDRLEDEGLTPANGPHLTTLRRTQTWPEPVDTCRILSGPVFRLVLVTRLLAPRSTNSSTNPYKGKVKK